MLIKRPRRRGKIFNHCNSLPSTLTNSTLSRTLSTISSKTTRCLSTAIRTWSMRFTSYSRSTSNSSSSWLAKRQKMRFLKILKNG